MKGFTWKQGQDNPGGIVRNILIVDDSALFRQTFKNILVSQFPIFRMADAGDGKEALEKIRSQLPDLIFMDVQLPGENGFQLTEKIKALYPEIIVIIITSYDSLEYREAAVQCGADLFISKKSSTTKEIVSAVKSLLAGRGVSRDEK
jgi:DNA-binding NarL/FixJ family response regulator